MSNSQFPGEKNCKNSPEQKVASHISHVLCTYQIFMFENSWTKIQHIMGDNLMLKNVKCNDRTNVSFKKRLWL